MLPTIENLLKSNSITELEGTILNIVCSEFYNNYDHWYNNFVDIPFKSLSKESGINYNRLKGIIGSLVKKEYLKSIYYDREYWIIITSKGLKEVCNITK